MFSIEQQQWDGFDNFRQLVKQASCELADSIETGMMSDSKTAVFKVREASKTLALPAELATQFELLYRERCPHSPMSDYHGKILHELYTKNYKEILRFAQNDTRADQCGTDGVGLSS